jgi:hypothetical protein
MMLNSTVVLTTLQRRNKDLLARSGIAHLVLARVVASRRRRPRSKRARAASAASDVASRLGGGDDGATDINIRRSSTSSWSLLIIFMVTGLHRGWASGEPADAATGEAPVDLARREPGDGRNTLPGRRADHGGCAARPHPPGTRKKSDVVCLIAADRDVRHGEGRATHRSREAGRRREVRINIDEALPPKRPASGGHTEGAAP